MPKEPDLRWAWTAALGCFGLAGATGALYRFGLLNGLPAGLQLGDVRHAHSHLMYFGWVTPALMALIARRLPSLTKRSSSNGFRWIIAVTLTLALLSYPLFLRFGYRTAEFDGQRVPLSVIAASLNILAWYAFGWLYLRDTRRIPHSQPLRLWDWAIVFQLLASSGAWGRAVLVAFKVQDPFWEMALVHLFLDLFSDGWFLLAILGLASAAHPFVESRRSTRLLVLGLPLTFLLGVPVAQVPVGLRLAAGIGGLLVALGLSGHIRGLWRHSQTLTWRIPLAFLGIKTVAELAISWPALALWAERAGLRVLYLHWSLLGFVTLGLIAAAQDAWGPSTVRGQRIMRGAVLLLLVSLIPLTQLWPTGWSGRWTLRVAAWATLIPVTAGLRMIRPSLTRTASDDPPRTEPQNRQRQHSAMPRVPASASES